MPQQAVAQQAVAQQAVAQPTVAQQAVAQQTVTQQAVAQQAVARQAVARQAVAQQAQASTATRSDLAYRVYLIGDTGGANEPGTVPALNRLREELKAEGENSAVVFLGDNIYCCGLPDSSSLDRAKAEMRLNESFSALDGFAGRTIFIPGNHDWGDAGAYSATTLKRQQTAVEQRFGEGSFQPQDGLSGPVEVKLTDMIRLVVLDTQWWMMKEKQFGESGGYEIEEEGDMILAIRDLLAKRDDEHVLMVGHHPLISFGEHGGRFSIADHIFPLRALDDRAWIPLPGIGSLYPLVRSIAGFDQDLSNPQYRLLRESLLTLFSRHTGRLVYASGHEHNLQHIVEGNAHLLVSGSGSRPSYVGSSPSAKFTSEEAGFMVLDYMNDGSVSLRVVTADGRTPHSDQLFPADPGVLGAGAESETGQGGQQQQVSEIALPSSVQVAADPGLARGPILESIMGWHNRDSWTKSVTAEVFNIRDVKGGLTPVQRGGGLQTISLRLEDSLGYQYVLRSINKDPSKTIPEELQPTLATDLVRDQNAILQPYGALMIPPLAEAAGLYYTTPKLYYIPDDPAFGEHTEVLAGQLMLFEERPDEDMSAYSQFGNSEDVVSSGKVFRELLEDNDHRVDAAFWVRARLFDMFLSDWDRHQDQWRWASFDDPDGNGDLFRPIPRDRDWAFNKMDGFFPSIVKSEWVMPKFQDFRPKYGQIAGLNTNGMPLDRQFAMTITRDEWVATAEDLAASITDADIDDAISRLPAELDPELDIRYRDTMKARLEGLPAVADRYYEILSVLADMIGSDKHELFDVTTYADSVLVRVIKTKKEGDELEELRRRVFFYDETEEIRLYGLGGNDRFVLQGTSDFPVRIYAIGGTGDDAFDDQTTQKAGSNNWFVMDAASQSVVRFGAATRPMLEEDRAVMLYNPKAYWTEPWWPRVIIGSNSDDGLIIGGGAHRTSYMFHREPFSSKHVFDASIATRSQAFTFNYEGLFNQRLGEWGILLRGIARTRGTIENFYGYGSNTDSPEAGAQFYETKIEDYRADLGVYRSLSESVLFKASSFVEYANVNENAGGFATIPTAGIDESDLDALKYSGLLVQITADQRDHSAFPKSGYRWDSSIETRVGLNQAADEFTTFTSALSLYVTPAVARRTTLALRVGGTHVQGSFPYYRSATVGSTTGLRGWRRDRFSGHSAFYQNVELRQQLFYYSTIAAVGTGGVLLHLDNARVWSDEDDASNWHQGVGGGLWFNLFDMVIFKSSLTISQEETYFGLGLGFDY